MDFVTGLPTSEGFNTILVAVDSLNKMRHLIPCNENVTALVGARLCLDDVLKLDGLPGAIVSDKGPQYTASFWSNLCTLLQIQPQLPHTDKRPD